MHKFYFYGKAIQLKKSMLKLLKAVLPILFISKIAIAQSEYVVLNTGDTINCNFQKGKKGMLMFNPLAGGIMKPVTADSISAYFKKENKSVFIAKKLPGEDKKKFLAVVEQGRINLYQLSQTYKTGGFSMGGMPGSNYGAANVTNLDLYAKKMAIDSLYSIKTNAILSKTSARERREAFNSLIGDDKELLDFFLTKEEFSVELITNMIKLYNKRNPIK